MVGSVKPPTNIKTIMDFMRAFNTEEKCVDYLLALKTGGKEWKCPKCGEGGYTYISTRRLIRCKACRNEESITSSSVMRKTRKPLNEWFLAIYIIATQKTGISAMELYRQMGFGSIGTAWTWLHKIRLAMTEKKREKLDFDVEVDETYLYTHKGSRGRRIKRMGKKSLVVCAVEVAGTERKPASGRVFLRAIGSASSDNLHKFIQDHVERGSVVRTDGWTGYSGLNELGFVHRPTILAGPEDAAKRFPRVHRVFSNLKGWIRGTHRFVSRKHLQNYLNEFSARFNARHKPIEAFNDVLRKVVLTEPRIYERFVKPKRIAYPNPNPI
jgi:transposase-like protein